MKADVAAHPAAMLFPMMEDAELQELADDIKANGLRHPVVLIGMGVQQQVLDGRNRLRACELAGIEAKYVPYLPVGESDPVDYVLSANLHRRHLNASQRAMLAVELKKLYAAETKDKGGRPKNGETKTGGKSATGKSRDRAARAMRVSGRSVQTAETVMVGGAPEVVEAVKAGKVTVSDAAKVVDLPAETQAALVEQVQTDEATTLCKAAEAVSLDATVTATSATTIAPVAHGDTFAGIPAARVGLTAEQFVALRREFVRLQRSVERAFYGPSWTGRTQTRRSLTAIAKTLGVPHNAVGCSPPGAR